LAETTGYQEHKHRNETNRNCRTGLQVLLKSSVETLKTHHVVVCSFEANCLKEKRLGIDLMAGRKYGALALRGVLSTLVAGLLINYSKP